MTLVLYVLGIVMMWVLAWGTLSWANILGGLAVAAALLVVVPGDRGRRQRLRVHPVALVRLAGFVLAQVVKSNWLLAREVVARQSQIHTGVLGVDLPDCSDEVVTLISNVMALTPGTTPIQVTGHPTVLYLHVLDMRDPEATRSSVQRLAELAGRAFPSHAPDDFGVVPEQPGETAQ